ncbi:iron uptake transporter deferrochelatase/peroxidase subunit [Paenibacillus sp. UNC451MF]|uniref:iron uptake transporter deferrochelatase/peroxidase subunit n=1 Tax=Paenibacillus sp. UNC451MF TaxID=1449063 RepID=UPI001E468A6A|nr:iron uptake transporter deferrochelatase/peroxidase subunit [Paenibacillus sp. UNC451MF]
MMDDSTKQEHLSDHKSTVSRRDLLKMAGAGGIGLLLGSVGVGGLLVGTGKIAKSASVPSDRSNLSIPFYNKFQAGILTPPQNFICFAAFDLTTKQASDVTKLFRAWTEASAKMAEGQMVGPQNDQPSLPPEDTGEAVGLNPNQLTITFGVGPAIFDERFGLASKRPEAFVDFPKFAGERLREEWCGGDIGVQVCADDMQVAFHAIRNLARIARGTAVLRWTQEGFQRSATAMNLNETPRNLLGFKDGTGNPDVQDSKLMNDLVWVQPSDGSSWMHNGTYMAVRRIRMRIEAWDRSTLNDQEATFGRYRSSGAPLGQKNEFDPMQLDAKNADGKPVIRANAHIRLAHGEDKEKILRRSYSYSSGIDKQTGQLDAGLFFICYNRDPRKQFIPIQQRLAKNDALNEYIFHMGSSMFACFPGVSQGGYLGEGLF